MNKFNWGHGLTIFILLFIATMIGLVVYSFQQSNEMIDDNYYQKEMEYQTLINAREKFNSILNKDTFIFENEKSLEFKFPKSTFESGPKGILELVKIDNEKLDIRIPISVDNSGIQVLSKDSLVRGNYRARIKWTNKADSFYYDHSFFVYK